MKIIFTIIAGIALFFSFVLWDYIRIGDFLWGENILQTFLFIVIFFTLLWLFSSSDKTKNNKKDKNTNSL